MKNLRKIISVLMVMCFLLSLCVFSGGAVSERKNYLLLGDSITQGFGVANPDEASYGKIIADTNGYNYTNDAMFARDSARLLSLLQNSYSMRYDVAKADIISLSIGSNDYLANDEVVSLVVGALLGMNNKKLNEIAENYYVNLCAIIDEIHSLNPDVVILIQNVYSAWNGFAGRAFNAGAKRVNKIIDRYIENYPDNGVYLCDIAPAITGHKERLADDCVHPNAEGNVEIAKIVLKQLCEMGLGTQTEPVVNVQGVDYNYFEQEFGKVPGALITTIVKSLTGNVRL